MKCYACEKKLERFAVQGTFAIAVKGEGNEHLYPVGPDCYKKIEAAEELGYKPPLGGPRLILPKYETSKTTHRLTRED